MEIKTDVWVGALVRRAEIGGAFAAIGRRGDRDAGAVLVKVATLDGKARLSGPALDGEGRTMFLDLSAGSVGDNERDVDAYARRRADNDPDLWLVEIEDRQGRHFLTEPVEGQGSGGHSG